MILNRINLAIYKYAQRYAKKYKGSHAMGNLCVNSDKTVVTDGYTMFTVSIPPVQQSGYEFSKATIPYDTINSLIKQMDATKSDSIEIDQQPDYKTLTFHNEKILGQTLQYGDSYPQYERIEQQCSGVPYFAILFDAKILANALLMLADLTTDKKSEPAYCILNFPQNSDAPVKITGRNERTNQDVTAYVMPYIGQDTPNYYSVAVAQPGDTIITRKQTVCSEEMQFYEQTAIKRIIDFDTL